jgi:hypothetical protein
MEETTPTVTLRLTAEEAEDLAHALSVATDALIHSDRHAALCALVGPEECDAMMTKLQEATR